MSERAAIGLSIRPTPGGSDPALRDILWRLGEFSRKYGYGNSGGGVCPDGRWLRVQNGIHRKVWEGYHRRVVLETELSPGSGWRTYMELPDGDLQYPVPYRDVYAADGGELKRRECVEIRLASAPEGVPRYPRHHAFRAAENFMSGYAMDSAERVAELERLGYGPDDTDE